MENLLRVKRSSAGVEALEDVKFDLHRGLRINDIDEYLRLVDSARPGRIEIAEPETRDTFVEVLKVVELKRAFFVGAPLTKLWTVESR